MEAYREKQLRFSGHQTFVFRYGWLEKGFKFVSEGHNFNDDNAIVELGVGKNMVESIKYWCEMAGVIHDVWGNNDKGIKVKTHTETTELGKKLLGGWDPFLEDDASLWFLHWKIITNIEYFTAGEAIFSLMNKPEFSKREAATVIFNHLSKSVKKPPSDSAISRDIDCYMRVYAGTRRFEKKKAGEESFACPLQELDLINPMMDGDMYRLSIGSKPSLPPEIIGYAIWEQINANKSQKAINLKKALYEEGSPGRVFLLDENSLIEAINTLGEDSQFGNFFSFTESAGTAMINCSLENGNELLEYYYNRRR
jgi:hypothetical protein